MNIKHNLNFEFCNISATMNGREQIKAKGKESQAIPSVRLY